MLEAMEEEYLFPLRGGVWGTVVPHGLRRGSWKCHFVQDSPNKSA